MLNKSPLPNYLLIFLLLFTVNPLAVAAKKTNDKPVDMEHAIKVASVVVNKLAEGEKIDKSWYNVKPKSAKTRQYPHGTEWVIAFKNLKVKNKSHQILYIFLTISGKYVAANYTGQ